MPTTPLAFASTHPAFAGHFPGNPIVPGVLLLDWVQVTIETQWGQRLQALTEAKFHSPATPTDSLTLHYEIGTTAVRFEIHSATRKIASGRFPVPHGVAA